VYKNQYIVFQIPTPVTLFFTAERTKVSGILSEAVVVEAAFAMPEAEDQVQNLTFTSGSTIYPSSITSDSAPPSDYYPAATISWVA